MKKIIFILCLLSIIVQANAQLSLKNQISDQRSGVSHPFITLEESAQVPFELRSISKTLGLDPQSELVLIKQEEDDLGNVNYRFYQTYKGVPIENSMYIIQTKNRKIVGLNGRIITDFTARRNTPATSGLAKINAINAALDIVKAKEYMWNDPAMERRIKSEKNNEKATFYPDPQLVWHTEGGQLAPNALRLAYKVDVYAKEPVSRADYFIDARSGKFIDAIDKIQPSAAYGTAATAYSGTVNIYSDYTGSNYRLRDYTKGSGVITLHGESGIAGTDYTSSSANWVLTGYDIAALDAHYGVSQTYTFYRSVLGRNSYNNAGAALYSYVNDPNWTNNAVWDGSSMHFGKLSSGAFGGVTGIDVTGHELTHGVTGSSSGLIYKKESGAMNESMSDIMGKAVQFYAKPSDINWQLSNDMAWIIRDMKNPNLKGQPDTYQGTYWQSITNSYDNYGVHTNSGVGNFMFYLLSTGGSGTNDLGNYYSVTGIGLLKAEKIIYRTNVVYLTPTSTYPDWRTACINAATDLYGAASTEVKQVKNAWYAVGIGTAAGGNYYCQSTATTSTYEYINKVALGSISVTSGNNGGYGNYTAYSTSLAANSSYIISLTPGFASTAYNEYWTVYIDYNQNGSLADSGELVATGSGSAAIYLGFKVPPAALNGKTRMRVQMNYGSASKNPCANLTYGEVEDYSIYVYGGITYCASVGSTVYEYINKVALGSINNTSGNNFGYGNYTGLKTTLFKMPAFTYTITLTPGFTSSTWTEQWNVYIDYNKNGSFTDAGEKVATGSGTGPVSASFTVPSAALLGQTRMRVQMQFGSAASDPCVTYSGEVEDYTVNIAQLILSAKDAKDAKLTDVIENKQVSVAVAPNPVVNANAKVLYTVNERGPVTLKVTDFSGRIVKQVSLGDKNAGSYTYNLNEISRLSSGNYVIIIEQNGRITARNKFIMVN